MMKKEYSVEIPYNTQEYIKRVEKLKEYLENACIPFDCCQAWNMIHFTITLDHSEVQEVNKMLDQIVWVDAIVERR